MLITGSANDHKLAIGEKVSPCPGAWIGAQICPLECWCRVRFAPYKTGLSLRAPSLTSDVSLLIL